MDGDDVRGAADPGGLSQSQRLYRRGWRVFPDGTTRVTVERQPEPIYIVRGEGAHLIDADGRRFLDLNNNFTTLIHGHGFAPMVEAVATALSNGTCFANPTESEIALAELIAGRIPSVERIRFVNSGTEAVMFAIKAARAFTGRPAIARFEGAYHGAYDWAEAGQANGPAQWGVAQMPRAAPTYRGMPQCVADNVVLCRFNDLAETERQLSAAAGRLACVLIDPMPSRAGLLHPDERFLGMLAGLADKHGILIVADEVLNLRQSYHGACARYGMTPDVIAMGKIIGGGFAIGAVGGRADVMRVFSANGGKPALPQGGTFSANPISMIAGRVAMEAMTRDQFDRLETMGDAVRQGLHGAIAHHRARFSVSGVASLFRIHPRPRIPTDYRQAYLGEADKALMERLNRHFLQAGIILPKGAAACLSTAMTPEDIAHIIETFAAFLAASACTHGENDNGR